MSRIVLFGATGYTGGLTAHSLASMVEADDDVTVVLAGRSQDKLDALLNDLALHRDQRPLFQTQVADVDDVESVNALVTSSDDVLISTVGPFLQWGQPAVDAVINKGATYIDSTGEAAFLRRLFEVESDRAIETGARLVPAFGYDFVPGNLAGLLALADAAEIDGATPTTVEIGYFISGGALASTGTIASMPGIILQPSYAFRGGKLRKEQTAKRTRVFGLGERRLNAVSIGGTEPFDLPAAAPSLQDIGVYLGSGSKWTEFASVASRGVGAVAKVPGVRRVATAATSHLVKGSAGGPTQSQRAKARSIAIAEVYGTDGQQINRVVLTGPSPYDLTADLMAWAAINADAISKPGTHGPVGAFGLPLLTRGCVTLGLNRAADTYPSQ